MFIRTKLYVHVAQPKGSPFVWPVLLLSSMLIDGLIVTGAVLYCRAKGWL